MPFHSISLTFGTNCAFVILLFCRFANSSPILIDPLVPSIVGVEVEDRISNPSSSANSSAATSSDLASIADSFSPDITSVDVKDEERTHGGETGDRVQDGPCVGDSCACPPGMKGVEPFCRPETAETEETLPSEIDDEEIPMEFYQKIAGLKNVEEFINATNINVDLRSGSITTTLPAEGCIPKKVCVSVRPRNRHPSEDVFPSSVDVERCGGCCGHPDLTCLPWSTEPMTVNLLKYGYNPDGSLASLGVITTSVIRELKCKCVKVQT